MIHTLPRRWILFTVLISMITIFIWQKANLSLRRFVVLQQLMIWVLTIFVLCWNVRREKYCLLLTSIRKRSAFFLVFLLIMIITGFLCWLGCPANLRYFFVVSYTWFAAFLCFPGLSTEEIRRMIRELSGSKWAGLLVTFTTVTFILMAAEIGLRNFLVTSEYVNPLMELEWRKKYWIPINEEKYRDYPIPRNVPPGTKRIVIVGDSFASGTGISRIKDTFPQILAQKLGKGFTVNIVARPGMDTTQEWVSLKAFPVKPDILILSYVYNDIDYLITKSDFRAHPSAPVIFLIKRTYVANILYRHGWSDIVYLEKYHHALISAYNNPELWKRQEKWLNRFVNYAAGMKCRLIVIVWPILGDSKEYAIPLQKVAEFFLKRNVTVVDLISPLGEHTGTEMAVSRFNSHPNERAHRIAAQALYDTIVNSQ